MKIPKIVQLPSGSFRCVVMIDGKRESITDSSYERVEAKVLALKTGISKARKTPEKLTLKEACDRYIKSAEGRLSVTTADGYQRIVDNAFPTLMNTQLCDISHRTLQRAVDTECKRLNARGGKYAPKTIENRYSFIATVLHDFLPDLDTAVTLPDVKDKPIFILTPEEVFEAVKGSPVELPVLLSMWLSFSMSELRGLTKSKSIHGDKITVVDTVVRVGNKEIRKEGGKEEKRTRTLTIPPYIKDLIDQVEGDIIVPATAASITSHFYRRLKWAGLPHMAFHKLRHINASIMAELQIQPKIANARGGWKTSYVRERVYTHTFSRDRVEADAAIDALFNGITHAITPNAEKV